MESHNIVLLRNVEEKHHDRLAQIAKTLYELHQPSVLGDPTPWDLLPDMASSLITALSWYRSDRDGGYFPHSYYSQPKQHGHIDGMFEARFFSVVRALDILDRFLTSVVQLYNLESQNAWTPRWKSVLESQGLRPNIEGQVAGYKEVVPGLSKELSVISLGFRQVCDEKWSGGWRC